MRDPPVPAPPVSGYQILAAFTRGLLAAASAEQLDTRELLARAGLTRAQLEDPDAFVPVERHFALREAISERLGFVNGGLRAGAAMYGDPSNVLAYAVSRSANHGRAVRHFCRYIGITNPGMHLACADVDGGMCLSAELMPGLWELGHPSEALFAGWVSIARVATRRRWKPLRVEFRHGARGAIDEHEAFFGCPVAFAAPATRLHVGDAVLALPIAPAPHPLDRVIAELEGRWLARVAANRHGEASSLCAALAGGPIDREAFTDALRAEAALVLHEASLAAYEVAFLLGFGGVPEVLALR
jgi:hypothetical protein